MNRRFCLRRVVLLPTVFVLVIGCSPGKVTLAESVVSGSTSWRDKAIHYKITGANLANASSSSDSKQCTVRIMIDGKNHELLINQTGLVYQGEPIPLNDFKEVEIIGSKEMVRIVVDGKQVHPQGK